MGAVGFRQAALLSVEGLPRDSRAGHTQEYPAVNIQDQVAQLFHEARDDVYRYLLTLGLDPARAQETAQDVFLRLYVTLKKGEDIQNRRAWVFRVAHNLGLNVRTRQKDLPPFEPELEARISDPMQNPEKDLL